MFERLPVRRDSRDSDSPLTPKDLPEVGVRLDTLLG